MFSRLRSLDSTLALLAVSACQPATIAVPKAAHLSALAIAHVTLIDPASGPRADVTIVIEGDRIVGVGPSATTSIPAGAAVYDATGSFAMPGLWDAHVHVSQIGPDSMALFVAKGVVSVR